MVVAHHVDEVDDDDAAQIAQAQLAGNRTCGFEVGLEDRVVEIACADVTTGVHVDGGQGFGLIDDEVAAGFQIDAPAQGSRDVFIDRVEIEDRTLHLVQLQLVDCRRHEVLAECLHDTELLARIDADRLRVFTHQIAQHALQQVQVLVQQRTRWLAQRRLANAGPGLAQIGNVLGQLGIGCVFAVGAQNEATTTARGLVTHEFLQTVAQGFALGQGDLLRHADMVVLRQKYQQAPGDADLCGQARALAADRVLDDLHHECLAFEDLLFNRHQRLGLAANRHGRLAGFVALPDVGHVQKCGAFKPDVDECGLHARKHPRDFAKVDIANQPALQRALDMQFLHRAVLHDGYARFLRGPIDENVLLH